MEEQEGVNPRDMTRAQYVTWLTEQFPQAPHRVDQYLIEFDRTYPEKRAAFDAETAAKAASDQQEA